MQESRTKIKRIQPLIGAEKQELDRQSGILIKIIEDRKSALTLLQTKQDSYLSGTQKLNELRASNDRLGLMTLENSLDHMRTQWMECLRSVKQFEQKEQAQRHEVHRAQVKLKSLEMLEDNYKEVYKEKLGKFEQKEMDEIAIQRFAHRV